VSENRSLWTAVSVALLSVGAGGYVSLKVATALLIRKVHVQVEIHACALVAAIAIVMIAVLTCLGIHSWWVRRKVAKFTLLGIGLLDETNRSSGDRRGDMTDIHYRYKAWVAHVETWLSRHDYTAFVHFRNPSGEDMATGLKRPATFRAAKKLG
jgi:hypothetical protein